jgi:hypothetical protein
VLGSFFGWVLGERLRARLIQRRLVRARGGRHVSVRAIGHYRATPEWQQVRGLVVRRQGNLSWRPRRWARLNWSPFAPSGSRVLPTVLLSDARVAGRSLDRSVTRGDHVVFWFGHDEPLEHLAVPADQVEIAETLLG